MGATVSVYQASQLPPVLEKEQFDVLTKKVFSSGTYEQIADHNGKVSRDRLVEIASMTDCYLSHEWGIDNEGRNTSDRVRKINTFLQSKGYYTKVEEGHVLGKNAFDMIREGIQKAQCVIICMTQRYFYQLSLPIDNPSKVEFYEAMNNRELRHIIPIVLEKAAYDVPEIVSKAYPLLQHKPHLDFTQFGNIGNEDFRELGDLQLYVTKCIRPLRDGGSFKQQRGQFLSTIVGRHYKWLIQHTPKFGHDLSMKYATILAEKEIESATRMWQLLQHDIGFLQKIGIPDKDAMTIRNALKSDLLSNMDTLNAKRIDAQIDAQNRINDAELQLIHEKNAAAIDMRIKFTELKLMSIADELSRGLREQGRMDTSESLYQQGRAELLWLADTQHLQYRDTLLAMRAAQRQRDINNDINYRREDFMNIGRISEPAAAIGFLYRLFIKIDRATAHLRPGHVLDHPEETTDLPDEYRGDYHFKRHRVQSFIDRASVISSMAVVPVITDVDLPDPEMTEEEKNGRLVFLLQEAAYVCRAITNLTLNSPYNVSQFAESGIVKLLMALLGQSYVFSCQFESLFMPMSFHYLAMPAEALLTLRYLVKCDIGRRKTSSRLAFLFGESGAVALCMEIVRFHLNDMNIASVAIEALYVLVSDPGGSLVNLKLLMQDVSNFILLMVVLEKYQEYFSPIALALHSCIIGITTKMAVTGEYEQVLRVYRGQLISPLFNSILPLIEPSSDPELCTRLCASLSQMFFSREYQNSHFFTSDFIPKSESFARELSKGVNYRVALRFLKKLMTSFIDNDVVIIAALVALGDMAFNHEKIKVEIFRMKLHENLVKILKMRMKRLDNAHPKWDSFTESIELEIDAVNTREVLYEGLITAANTIIVPPFLTYDTQRPEDGVNLEAEIVKARMKNPAGAASAAAMGNVKLPAAVTEEMPSSYTYFVQHGLAELLMNIVTNYKQDRVLVRSALVFANKFVYRGRYISTLRLVKLRFCEHMMDLMKLYAEDEEMYMLCVMVVTGLLSSHPSLVGAAKRLLPTDLCELLVTTMRNQCQVHQCSQSRAWTHFSFPYTCRVCIVHCTAVYCCLTSDQTCSAEAYARLAGMNFHGMLQCPPPYVHDALTLENAVVLPGRGAGEPPLPGAGHSEKNVTVPTRGRRPEEEDRVVAFGSIAEDADGAAPALSAEAAARQRMMVAGVFQAPVAGPALPAACGSGGISSATMMPEEYAGCTRNVDFVAYISRKEKDHIMSTLFKSFNVE